MNDELVHTLLGLWSQVKDQDRLEKLLVEGKGGTMFGILSQIPPMSEDDVSEVVTRVLRQFEEGQQVTRDRIALHLKIDEAQSAVAAAVRIIEDLGSIDVEYMDGHADLERALDDAARALRTAQAVKPSDRKGETR